MWAQRGQDGDVRVGFTDAPCAFLSDVVYAELPPPGTEVREGEPVGLVESSAAVCEIVAPVSGVVVDVNPVVGESPETITADPFGRGWLLVIRPSDPPEMDALWSADEYDRRFPPDA